MSFCLLRRLRRGPCDTVLKYERIIMCTLLYSSKWHQDLHGQAHSEEFVEGMLSKLVRDTGHHYLLLQVARGGTRVGGQNVPKNLRQQRTRFSATDRFLIATVEWEFNRVSSVAPLWSRRISRIPPSPTQPLGRNHYRLLGHGILDAFIDQKTNFTNQLKQKLDAAVGRRTDMDAEGQEAGTRNVRQHVR